MKRKSINLFLYMSALATLLMQGCDKELDKLAPHNLNFENQQFKTPNGFTKATIGNYTSLYSNYETPWYNISEFRGNNVRVIDVTAYYTEMDIKNTDAFNFKNSEFPNFGYSDAFWFASYKALLGINMVLKNINDDETNSTILQAKAENLFLRAFINFNLLRVYGRPHYQNATTNPGIPLVIQPLDFSVAPPVRSSVQACYEQIIKDLDQAIVSFRYKGTNSFASKYAAFALLSRVYLYMSDTFEQPNVTYAKMAVQTADSVITKGGYQLLRGNDYINYYKNSNTNNTETIWAVNHDVNVNSLPTLLMQPQGNYVGMYSTGQVKPSPDLISKMVPADLRNNFYYSDLYPGNTTDVISTGKFLFRYFNGVNAVYTSAAPFHHLRLAETYLNRAEAKLKAGDSAGALDDLNVIHTRAGLPALTGISGKTLFDAILLDRRLELAFEGHNSYDYFRNGLPMVRSYSSFNSPAITIAATDPSVVMRISQMVLTENPNINQNKQ